MSDDEEARLNKLSPEQRVTAERWLRENKLLSSICSALNNAETYDEARLAISAYDSSAIADQCEHGRNVHLSCMACDEIEEIMYPDRERYDEEGEEGEEGETNPPESDAAPRHTD